MYEKLITITSTEGDMIVMQENHIVIAVITGWSDTLILDHDRYLEHTGLEISDLINCEVIAHDPPFRVLWVDA